MSAAGADIPALADRYNFDLPPDRIARYPADRRDESRLIVALPECRGYQDAGRFKDIGAWLRADDLLVLNDTRVLPARLWARRASGGKVEALVLDSGGSSIRALVRPLTKLRVGEALDFGGRTAVLVEKSADGAAILDFSPLDASEVMSAIGEPPIPPYLKRAARPDDRDRYQTVYAERPGAIAAPTAGLHFTSELIDSLTRAGVDFARLTLHVGYGTFAPVEPDQRELHPESYEIPEPTLERIHKCESSGGRVIAVGTTVLRALESYAVTGERLGRTRIFMKRGHKFRYADAMITNFHLPGSSLLMLAHAFAGDILFDIYRHAVEHGFRFFSYGDAMLLGRESQ